MSDTPSVAELARRCAEETARYLRREPFVERFCLQLFRRAIALRDDDAWAAIYAQYAGPVRQWLAVQKGDEDDDVSAVFARFWRAVDAAKLARFGSLAAVLQYLKMCAHSVRMERMRSARARAVEEAFDEEAHAMRAGDDVAATVSGRADAAALWRTVRECVPDERERLVLYLSYAVGLTPREIRARHADRFPDVAEVYQLKRAALDRLRRAPEVQALR